MNNLCATCRHGTVIDFSAETAPDIVHCSQISERIRFPVYKCTDYDHKLSKDLWELKEEAWIIDTNSRSKFLGFAKPKSDRHTKLVD